MSKAKRGRPPGAANKITNEAKRAILMAFDKLGGAQRLVDWVNADPANEALYWTRIFPRLLPRPAADAEPSPALPPPVRGALIWEKPTPAPFKPLASSVVEAVTGAGLGRRAGGRKAGEPPG